jgi:hypothetical protein
MSSDNIMLRLIVPGLLLVWAGCELGPAPIEDTKTPGPVCEEYIAANIDILPLTEFVATGEAQKRSRIKVFVSLLDSFGCQIKSPGVFRFELYDVARRPVEPRGRRVVIWPDIDLTDPTENNNYWRDYLRAYEFYLDFDAERSRSYILETTCTCPNGRRLSDHFALKPPE